MSKRYEYKYNVIRLSLIPEIVTTILVIREEGGAACMSYTDRQAGRPLLFYTQLHYLRIQISHPLPPTILNIDLNLGLRS
jgi:hypothetical protein